MNSSKNNKRGGYYWNQPAPCTEEEVGRLMLENIKLLLQKKESDVEPNKGDDRNPHQELQQQEALQEQDDKRTKQRPQQQQQSISDEELRQLGWEIDTGANPKIYSHYALPQRIKTDYPTKEEIKDATVRHERNKRTSVDIGVARNFGDKQRTEAGLQPSKFAIKRQQQQQQKQQGQQQQQTSVSSLLPSPRQASAPPEPLSEQQKYNKMLETTLEQIPSLPNMQPTEITSAQKQKIEQIISLLAEPNLPTNFNSDVITGIRGLRVTLLQ